MEFQPSEEEKEAVFKRFERTKNIVNMLSEFAELNKFEYAEFRAAVCLYLCGDFKTNNDDLEDLKYFVHNSWKLLSKMEVLKEEKS